MAIWLDLLGAGGNSVRGAPFGGGEGILHSIAHGVGLAWTRNLNLQLRCRYRCHEALSGMDFVGCLQWRRTTEAI